ncbi:MAG: hypothetical protein HQL28_06445 [Candidatus Omnitrophica bacterium]|nr:hypothetical protein [Candidatus Omnitrophota bacterium]
MKIYSFDVFDTALTRYLLDPKDLYIVVQRKLRNDNFDIPEKLKNNFYSERMIAEINARVFSAKEDIVHADIYAELEKKFKLSKVQSARLMELENDLEYESVSPIAWTINAINELREEGHRIIFVSNMYLSSSHIRRLLEKVGAYKEGDGLYVSGELNATKTTGTIFKYVIEKEGCGYQDLYHIGDNLHCDVYVPSKLGINIYKTSYSDISMVKRWHFFIRFRGRFILLTRALKALKKGR